MTLGLTGHSGVYKAGHGKAAAAKAAAQKTALKRVMKGKLAATKAGAHISQYYGGGLIEPPLSMATPPLSMVTPSVAINGAAGGGMAAGVSGLSFHPFGPNGPTAVIRPIGPYLTIPGIDLTVTKSF